MRALARSLAAWIAASLIALGCASTMAYADALVTDWVSHDYVRIAAERCSNPKVLRYRESKDTPFAAYAYRYGAQHQACWGIKPGTRIVIVVTDNGRILNLDIAVFEDGPEA